MPKPETFKSNGTGTEVKAPPQKRRSWLPSEKLRIVRAAAACSEPGAIGALLRQEGINSSHLSAWRRVIADHDVEGLSSHKRGRKARLDAKDRYIADLEKKLHAAEREVTIARGLLELQKKVSQLLGVTLPTSEPS